jgi:hypothetical protein
MNYDIASLVQKLVRFNATSPRKLVQEKSAKALADLKRARTLIEKAELTLKWCERDSNAPAGTSAQ